MITYRIAEPEEIPILTDLRIELLNEINNEVSPRDMELKKNIKEYFIKHFSDNSFVAWLALDAVKIVGTSGICFYEHPPSHNNINGKVGYIMNMYTIKEYRNHGIASKLFKLILNEGKKRGIGKFSLHATSEGCSLYKKFDFKMSEDEMIR
jgi:GNAT superfamily N-acetyltransferase